MSSLIFYLHKDMAIVVTDTLAVDEEGNPFIFTNKASYIPTLKTVIAGTGIGRFSSEWASFVNNEMVLFDIENLNVHTQPNLSRLWNEFKSRFQLREELTTTIYQLGYSKEGQCIKGFVYRSSNGFSPEELDYGTFAKPACDIIVGNLDEAFPQMMRQQRAMQDALPRESRVYIGGEMHAMVLTANECRQMKIGEFDDYQHQLDQLLQ